MNAGVGKPGERWSKLISLRAVLMLWVPIALVSFFHYATSESQHWVHDLLRRLYYIPIVLGALTYGLKGGLAASLVSSVVYFPHAFTHMFEHDPAVNLEKLLEIALYNIVAVITGVLAGREHRERLRQEAIAGELAEALEDKKVLEEQLIRAGKLKALGELTAGIAHEIKNPLASIKGAAEAIEDEIPKDSPRRKMVEIQKRELKRLDETLERFLSFARPDSVMMTRLDLGELIGHVVHLVEPQARKKSVELVGVRGDEQLLVSGDKDQISQVLLNLVINSIDAVGEGGRISLAVRKERIGHNQYHVVEVSDSGPGIPENLRDRIFNPFFSTKEGGTGLGLSISASIMDGHQGFIRVDENAGSGARFSVFFPVKVDARP